MDAQTKEEIYNLLADHYYDHTEFEHIQRALDTVMEGEDNDFQERILKKFLLEFKHSWEEDLKATFADPEDVTVAKEMIAKANNLLTRLR